MTEKVQAVAEGMERAGAGAGVAVGSWIANSIVYLDHHSQAVLAICGIIGMAVGIIGMAVGVVGLMLKWCYMRYEHQLLAQEHKARMRLLKQGKLPK